jgi:hypothetical protein
MRMTGFAVLTVIGSSLIGGGTAGAVGFARASLNEVETVYLTANEPSHDFKRTIQEALTHAQKANQAGKDGKHEELVQHSRKALDLAKEAQRAGHNERLNEGVYALGEAIEHGQKQQTKDATEHVMHAIMKLSQSADLQVPEGAIPPAS